MNNMEINLSRLKRLIKKSGLTQTDVAKIINCSRPTISNKLKGKQPFNRKQISALAKELHMTVEEVVAGKKQPNKEKILWEQVEWARKEAELKQQTIDELKAQLVKSQQTIKNLRAKVKTLQEKN